MSHDLAVRILDAFPSGSYSLSAFLRLLDIVETDAVETAAVECRVQPRLLVNPAFVEEHAETPEKLLMLVMHELHHVLLGHTTLFPRLTPTHNFVFDAVINGIVCRMFPGKAYTDFFRDYYPSNAFPACLLAPPPGWPDGRISVAAGILALPLRHRKRVAQVHEALYSEVGASYEEVYELLPKILAARGRLRRSARGAGDQNAGNQNAGDQSAGGQAAEAGAGAGAAARAEGTRDASKASDAAAGSGWRDPDELVRGVPLLGGHDEDALRESGLETRSPVLFDVVRSVVEEWPQPPQPIRGRSLADVIAEREVVVSRRPPSNRARLRKLIGKVAGVSGRGSLRRLREDRSETTTPIPTLARRSLVLRALGHEPLLHAGEVAARRRGPYGDRVHVYLDVSGSMSTVLGALYAAIVDCAELVHPSVHLFSTKVVDISLADLRRGRCHTTGGTSLACVVEHLAAHRVRRALLLTDGWVGRPEGEHREILARTRLAVAYAGVSTRPSDLEDVTDYSCILNEGGSR
jgi:hypothetical protein